MTPAAPPHRLVRASAGSGKTFQLTNALLALLLRGEEPSAILATTFTKAAAGEILHQTLARLSKASLDADALEQVRRHCDAGATHETCAQALERVARSLDRLSVMTIDAFFQQLAGAHAMEIGIAPGWRIISEDEELEPKAAAVQRAIEKATEPERIELLAQLQGEELRARAHHALMDVVDQGYSTYLSTDDDHQAWERVGAVGAPLSEADLRDAVARLQEAEVPLTKSRKPNGNFVRGRNSVLVAIEQADWEKLSTSKLARSCLDQGPALFYNIPVPEALTDALRPLVEHARHKLTSEHVGKTFAARRLLERFDEEYARLKQDRGVATFADPPRLLARSLATGELDTLYYRLDGRIRHVLLDEFQDTSMSQFRLLAPMLDELLSQADGRSVFCVGDVKQSLYSWRGAEPELLEGIGSHWTTFAPSTLSTSWRSAQPVLDAVNEVFLRLPEHPSFALADHEDEGKTLAEEAAREVAETWRRWFVEGRHVAENKDRPGLARLSVAAEDEDLADESGKLSLTDANRAAMRTVVDRVQEIREEAPGATIAVIVRTGDDLQRVLRALQHADIDASEERGSPLADSPPVAAAVSLLKMIDHPGDSASRFHVASTPLGPVVGLTNPASADQARDVARALRRTIAERGLASTLLEWKRETAGAMKARGAARFDQLIEAAATLDRDPAAGPSDLARVAEERRFEEAGGGAVRVMTIHKSKGLEYDAVVAPMLETKHPWAPSRSGYLATRDEALGPITRVTRYPSGTLRALHPELQEMYASQHRRDVNEQLCCLYVAMTRARRRLEIIVPADEPGRTGEPLEWSRFALKPSHIARGALAPKTPATPSRPGKPARVLWERGDAAAWSRGIEQPPSGPSRPIVTLRLAENARRAAGRLATTTPSAGENRCVGAADLLGPSGKQARTFGTLMHRWFEMIEWLETGEPSDAQLLEAAEHEGFGADAATPALESFRRTLEASEIRAALSRHAWLASNPGAQEATALRERSFAIRRGEGPHERLVRGQIDRLVIGRRDGAVTGAQILDFKTDSRAADMTEDQLRGHAESHRGQLESYRDAAARQLRIEEHRVSMALAFLAAGRVVELKSD